MKKIILSLSLLLTVAVTTAVAAAEPGINEQVKESFKKEFAGAELIRWADAGQKSFLQPASVSSNDFTGQALCNS